MAHAIDYIYYCNFVLLLSLDRIFVSTSFRLPVPPSTAFNVSQAKSKLESMKVSIMNLNKNQHDL